MISCLGRTLPKWANKAAVICGERAGVLIEMTDGIGALETENSELHQAIEMPPMANAHFAPTERARSL